MHRNAEALVDQLPNELKTFSDTCGARASALRTAAEALGESALSRFELGEKALFEQRACLFDALQRKGQLALEVLPSVPPADATMERMTPWIMESLRSAARSLPGTVVPGKPLTSKVHQCLLGCVCALSSAQVVCQPVASTSLPKPNRGAVSAASFLGADARSAEADIVTINVSYLFLVPV